MEQLRLTPSIVGAVEINRLLRELDNLNDFFVAARIRTPGTAVQPPKISGMLSQLAIENKLNLIEESSRAALIKGLTQIVHDAPNLHISFASEPSPKALEKILIWMRGNIHPHVLLRVGLQPAIAAGCVLRTPNKVFDMSMRNNLKNQEPYLVKLIVGASNE